MKYANYSEVRDSIARRREFKGNSAYGKRVGSEYQVHSYRTIILAIEDGQTEPLYFDNRFYSMTTSKLQGIIKRALDIPAKIERKVYSAGCYQVA